MGTKISIPKHTASEATARGRASATSSAWSSIIFAIILGLVGIGLLIAYAIPQRRSCVVNSECTTGDTCDKNDNKCKKATRNIAQLIGGLICILIAGILGFAGKHNFDLSHDDSYDRQLGERLIRQDAANAANAPYYAGAAAIEAISDRPRRNYGYNYNYNY